jgi:1-acyl-sn-glycerol-3-phosphate acyltransferase
MWYKVLKGVIKVGLYAYHRKIEVHGLQNIPTQKPVLFLPNHQSALLDVLLVAVDCQRKPYFLTRSDVFGKPLLNSFFKFLRMVPIYRIRDGRDTLSKNDAIFDACAKLLNQGEAIVMFPEANHNLRRRVRPLSKGFTRVLFRALEANPDLDIQLVPVGLNYKHAQVFPDEVALYYGKPIPVLELFDETDEKKSINEIKEAVSVSLKDLTTHIAPQQDYDAISTYLEEQKANFLDPISTNGMIRDWNSKIRSPKPVHHQKIGQNLLYPIFFLVNFPVILLWKCIVRPRVWEPEFTGTLRFATALIGFLIYFSVLLLTCSWLLNLTIGLLSVFGIFLFNCVYVRHFGPASH